MSLQCRRGGPWAFLSRDTDGRGQHKKKISEERSLKETRLVSVAGWLIQSAWLITAGDSPLAEGDSRLCKHPGQCPEIKEPKCSHRKGAGNGAWAGKLNALLNQQRHPTMQGRMGGRGRRCHCTSPKQPALEEETTITGLLWYWIINAEGDWQEWSGLSRGHGGNATSCQKGQPKQHSKSFPIVHVCLFTEPRGMGVFMVRRWCCGCEWLAVTRQLWCQIEGQLVSPEEDFGCVQTWTPLGKALGLQGEQRDISLGLKPAAFSLWSWHICLQSSIQSATSHRVQPAWTVFQ